ncbi:MAG: CDP-diacylglycerol--glycerol-3-phosphate 3-phosphatidyltransferase [Clostridia bacterium]|nr:CDP-diacylglycerol--glycerol-3-phosphate 3-phosphatidyltransferase [Clostridia bacterium]
MSIPNIITMFRFFLVFLFVYFFYSPERNSSLYATITFIVAGISDFLDGYIARKYNMVTEWGKLLDPLADKLMIIAVLYCLTSRGVLPPAIIIIVVIKEMLMGLGAVFLYKKGKIVVGAKWYGKIATVLFYIAIIMIVFEIKYGEELLLIAIASTILAFIRYAIDYFKLKKTI